MERLGTRVHPCRRLPAQIALQPVAGLLVRQALMGLEDHHRRQRPGRDRRAPQTRRLVQIGEVVVAEHDPAMVGQQQVDPPQPAPQQHPRILETGLDLRPTKRHAQVSPTRPQNANPATTTSGRS